MDVFKLSGAIFISLGGILSSLYLNGRVEKRLREAEAAVELLKYFKEQIVSFGMPLNEILRKCPRHTLEDCGFLWERDIYKSAEELSLCCYAADEITRKSLSAFFAAFGKSGVSEQAAECDRFIGCCSERYACLSADAPKQKKVNTSLCISASLALIIIML